MEPLKITFRFRRPVTVTDHPIHLDSLVAWAVTEEKMEDGDPDPWTNEDLPLGRQGEVWQASQLLFYPESEVFSTAFYKRHNLHEMARDRDVDYVSKKDAISNKSGWFRAAQIIFFSQWMEKAECWCIGDKNRIKALLGRLDSVGKYGRNGLGRIKSVTVVHDEQATRLWQVRTLPATMEKPEAGYALALRTVYPPYWTKTRRVPAWVPVDPFTLSANLCRA